MKRESGIATELLDALTVEKAKMEELLEVLMGVVNQSCLMDDNIHLDSMALTDYADAMRLLERYGKLKILKEGGRRVIGVWVASG